MIKNLDREYLEWVVNKSRHYTSQGEVADYIPELKRAYPHYLGISIYSCDGESVSAGDAGIPFTMQSMAKVPALLLALEDNGEEAVFDTVGMEPTGDPFDSIMRLEILQGNKPLNPMINAGAIAIASMIHGESVEEKVERMLAFVRRISGNPEIDLDERVYLSEKKTGDRNRSLAYFMRDTGVIRRDLDIEEVLDFYFRYNAIRVQCSDLAKIGCFLSTYGKLTQRESHVSSKHVRIALSIMVTSGMYNASGAFAMDVGVPSKSGVSGGVFAAVPGKMGIGVFSPAINEIGNSVAGVEALKVLSEDLGLNIFG